MTVQELFYEWLDCHQKNQIKIQTYVRYKSIFEINIRPRIGDRQIASLTKREMQEFMNAVLQEKSKRTGKPLSGSSVNMVLILCKLIFGYAVDFDLLPESPCSRLKGVPQRGAAKVTAFTREEQRKIETYVENLGNPEYFGILFDLYTGLRIGELLALTWDDIDLSANTLTVNKTVFTSKDGDGNWKTMVDSPKSRTSNREIPLPDWLVPRLKELKKRSRGANVVCRNDGSSMSPRLYRWRFGDLLRRLEIPPHHFHALRHTFATRAMESGMDVRTLADILGHANPNVTLTVYSHSLDEHKRNMMNNLKKIGTM